MISVEKNCQLFGRYKVAFRQKLSVAISDKRVVCVHS